ncbi:gamma-glutamylcyclotransferase family protein [Sulfitobacter sp. MF3-043]|uniref:gamma-glutamylcyclotransferase family protein n=1 Tax=Sulfitobacter sediminivivens TaxID=3252902 RepID=UPI0036DC10BC
MDIGGLVGREILKKVLREESMRAFWRAITFRSTKVRFFREAEDGSYNHAFYEYFIKKIRDAESEIYITGDGFDFSEGAEGEAISSNFVEAFRVALRNGVKVVRLQTRSGSHEKWVTMLGDLLSDHPETFELALLLDAAGGQLVSTCVIDPNNPRKCVVETMLTTRRRILGKETGLAGTAVFIERSRPIAEHLAARVADLASSKAALQISTPDLAKVWISKKILYFSYGSNMSKSQIEERVGDVDFIGKGTLNGHDMVFSRKGSYRPGAVASVHRAPGSSVHGVIYSMSNSQLDRMDEIEDREAYQRQPVIIVNEFGDSIVCAAHIAFPEDAPPPPDTEYVDLIVKSAREVGLPDAYIERLQRFKE